MPVIICMLVSGMVMSPAGVSLASLIEEPATPDMFMPRMAPDAELPPVPRAPVPCADVPLAAGLPVARATPSAATATTPTMTASIRNLITASSLFSRSVTPVTPGTPPTLGITRPARHRPSGHKLSRPPMPQGLSAHRPPAYPGPARQEASTKATSRVTQDPQARVQERPAQRGHVSPPGTAPREPQQHREEAVVAEPGPPRSQRHHERAGRLQPAVPRLPETDHSARAEVPADLPPQARRIRRSAGCCAERRPTDD